MAQKSKQLQMVSNELLVAIHQNILKKNHSMM